MTKTRILKPRTFIVKYRD